MSRGLQTVGAALVGLVLAAHGLVHLFIWPGGIEGNAGTTGWDGTMRGLDVLPEGLRVLGGRGLVVLSAGLFLLAGLSWVRRPWRLRRAGSLTVAAGAASLATFVVLWPGILPGADEFWRGPVLSGTALVVGAGWWARTRPRPGDLAAGGLDADADPDADELPTG